jgi:hypothetical protein
MSIFRNGARAGATVTTVGALAVAGVGGAVAAGVLAVASTQVAANVTQPGPTTVNVSHVNAPNYADN